MPYTIYTTYTYIFGMSIMCVIFGMCGFHKYVWDIPSMYQCTYAHRCCYVDMVSVEYVCYKQHKSFVISYMIHIYTYYVCFIYP